nr:hypothetical protein [Nitrosomonas sp.]
ASGVSYDCNQDLQSSFGVTWRIYEVVRKIYYLKLQDLFSASLTEIDAVFRAGGAVHWLTPGQSSRLICLQMYQHPLQLSSMLRVWLRGWQRADRRVSEIWIMPEVPLLLRAWAAVWGRLCGLKVLLLETAVAQDSGTKLRMK